LEELAKRRGYRLETEISVLQDSKVSDHASRVKSDYRETISDMMIENVAPVWTQWARGLGFQSRYQAHGSPANLLDLYALSDIPETEMFNLDRSIMASKFASSAAHVAGRNLVASETGTWLKEHFTVTLADLKDLVDELFLAGVNHVFYHGTCYSPDEAGWPGWCFYASTQMNPRNSIWRDVPALNAYIARCQAVLQAGKPDNDVLLYWPIHDIWHDPEGLVQTFTVHGRFWIEGLPVGEIAQWLWKNGYGFDYVSDRQLLKARTGDKNVVLPGNTYRTIVIPPCEFMPAKTLANLISLAEGGATVIFVDHLPKDVPGAGNLTPRRQQFQEIVARAGLAQAAGNKPQIVCRGKGRILVGPLGTTIVHAGIQREKMVDHPGLHCIRRALDDGHYYFVSCRGKQPVDGWIPLGIPAQSVAILEPLSGRIGMAAQRRNNEDKTEIYLQLRPGQSMILRTFKDRIISRNAWEYRRIDGNPIDVAGVWKVEFIEGGPELPPLLETANLASWTEMGVKAAEKFAGTACYSITFDAPTPSAEAWLIDLGKVCQSARVRLNGQDLGTFFTQPFSIPLLELKPTGNILEVEVTNNAANRIRDLDQRGIPWRNFHDINFVSITYQPFDASGWPPRDSGLLGPVRLFRQKLFTPE